jgi:threonine dehydrogenase-like Zn-dependent dehydrogenase
MSRSVSETSLSIFTIGVCCGALATGAAFFAFHWKPGHSTVTNHVGDKSLALSSSNISAGKLDLEDMVVSEHLSRNLHFFGEDVMKKLMGSYVVVVGLGGVGSHAAHLLLRSGVGHLKLVDFDQVR